MRSVEDALCAHFKLVCTLLTAYIQHLFLGQIKHGLQRKGTLTNAWLTTKEDDAARNQSAT